MKRIHLNIKFFKKETMGVVFKIFKAGLSQPSLRGYFEVSSLPLELLIKIGLMKLKRRLEAPTTRHWQTSK